MEERDEFPEKYNFPKLSQEEIESLSRPITSTEVESVIRNFPTNKSPGPDSFTAEFYQKFRRANTYPTQTLPENCREGKLPNSFCEASTTLIPKPYKDATHTKKKRKKKTKQNYRPISMMNIDAKSLTKF